ncbi:MAG: serine/threonine-protein kinase [Kofleriaceae bacterium]
MSEPSRPAAPALPGTGGSARPRTMSRLKAEAMPGMEATSEALKTIGRYEIIKTVGRGAMGIVYKARDPLLDRTVAVKTIVSPQGVGRRVRAAYIERFQREAKAAAKMQHPSIVTIFDVGVDEEPGTPFMVLEYLPGESLGDRLDRVRIPIGHAVQIGLDLASALSFAHRQRIVHRDVKPANVLHAGENRWKLADFGIARLPDSDLTQAGIFMGTPGYSPPEAIREGRYTAQADVFAWGAVLYEVLCGRIPYEGPDTKTTNGYVVRGEMVPPTDHDPSIPTPIVEVVMKALSGDAATRYRDASEAEAALRDAWQRCLTEGLVSAAVLAMDEIPHERAPAQMHAGPSGARRAGPSRPPPKPIGAVVETGERTVVDAMPSGDPFANVGPRERGTGDDDPTRVVRRDELETGGARRAAAGAKSVGHDLEPGGLAALEDDTGAHDAATTRRQALRTGKRAAQKPPRRTGLIVLVVLLVLVAGGAAAAVALGIV